MTNHRSVARKILPRDISYPFFDYPICKVRASKGVVFRTRISEKYPLHPPLSHGIGGEEKGEGAM
jgi:hypothetical protein